LFPSHFDPEVTGLRWILAVRSPPGTPDLGKEHFGFSFRERVMDAIATSFVLCLKVVRSTKATCSIAFEAGVHGNCVEVTSDPICDFYERADPPRCDWPATFEDADVKTLNEVWSGIISVRRLNEWRDNVFSEKFFADLDKAARRRVHENFREHNELFPKLMLEDKDLKHLVHEFAEKFLAGESGQEVYKKAFREIFDEEEQRKFNVPTRIGRALGIFEEGVHLPPLHAFLSACLVLETLFTTDASEVAHKVATRICRMLAEGKGLEERRELFKTAKRVYRERSRIVHGSAAIADIDEQARREAFNLARQTLRWVLVREEYRSLYCASEVSGAESGGLKKRFEDMDIS
jgi:hypothetical protein